MFLKLLYAAVVIVGCFTAYRVWDANRFYASLEAVPEDQVAGVREGDLSVVLFFDYDCPYCKDFYPILLEAVSIDRNTRIILRPLQAFDPEKRTGEAAFVLAAAEQGYFLEMHDALVPHYDPLTQDEMGTLAREIGIDVEKLLADSQNPAIVEARLAENVRMAERLGVRMTPTALIGRMIYTPQGGMPTPRQLAAILDAARSGKRLPDSGT